MQRSDDPHRYDDMLDMPHHVSEERLPMPLLKRAAQFSPFAALTGYEDRVAEAARETERRITPDEGVIEQLDAKLRQLQEHIKEQPEITVTYFRPDTRKDGGAYVTVTDRVRAVDPIEGNLVFLDRSAIPLRDILELRGDCLREPDDFTD